MPIYEYHCTKCGPFTAMRPMAQSAAPSDCVSCGRGAARVLSATFVVGSGHRRRTAGATPNLVTRDRDPERERAMRKTHRPAPAKHGHLGRPWMMGH